MKIIFTAFAAVLFALLSSCATVTRGSEEVFEVYSTPEDAIVRLSNGISARTPASFKVKRRDPLNVTISKAGYKTRVVRVESQIDAGGGAAMAGNVVVGGLIGAAIDAGSGAMYVHKPNPLRVVLEKK